MRKPFAVLCLVLASGLTGHMGCGGGGGEESVPGTGPIVTPPAQDVRGTYRLAGFDAEIYEDASCAILAGTMTPDDFANWSGGMVISDTTITQDYLLDGRPASASGSYTLTYTGESTGVFHVVDGSGPHDIGFSADGIQLTTDSGCVDYLGLGIREVDIWEKTSDHVARLRAQITTVSHLPLGGAAGISVIEQF